MLRLFFVLLFAIVSYDSLGQTVTFYNEFHDKCDSANAHTYSITESDMSSAIESFYDANNTLFKNKIYEIDVTNSQKKLRLVNFYYDGEDLMLKDFYGSNLRKPDSSYTYHKNGNIIRKEFYLNDNHSRNASFDSMGKKINYIPLRHSSFFECGFKEKEFLADLAKKIVFSDKIRRNATDSITLEIISEKNKRISAVKLIKSSNRYFDEAVLSTLKKMSIKGCPKTADGIYHKSKYTLSFNCLNLSEALEAWISKHFKSSLPISTYDDKKPIVKKLRADTSISMSPLDTNLYRFFTIRGNRLIEKRLRVSDSSLVDSINYLRVSFKKKKKKVEKVISSFSYYSNGKLQVKQFYNTSLERIYKVRSERLDSLFSYYENGLLKRQEFSDSKNKSKTTCYKLDGSKIEFTPFQILASFPGGEDAMMRWLGMNIKYPKSAFEAGIAGIVYSNFFVNKEGYLTDIKISRGVSEDIDDEVLRVIKAMPRWSPAILDDKKVISYFTLPIEFGEPE